MKAIIKNIVSPEKPRLYRAKIVGVVNKVTYVVEDANSRKFTVSSSEVWKMGQFVYVQSGLITKQSGSFSKATVFRV